MKTDLVLFILNFASCVLNAWMHNPALVALNGIIAIFMVLMAILQDRTERGR